MDFSGTVKSIALLMLLAARASSASPEPLSTCRPASLWLVSTRGLPCDLAESTVLDSLEYWQCRSGNWQPADADAFLRQAARGRLTYFVHGNWITSSDAFRMGAPVRDALSPDTGPSDTVVIWSWPAAQDSRHRLADVREKAGRSESHGWFLAEALKQVPTGGPVALVGYSYGARLITSALEFHEGASKSAPLSAVLMAAAVDDHWILPGHRHGATLGEVDRLLVLVNGQDPVLQRYRFLYGRRSGAQALGFVGLPCAGQFGHVEQWRVDGYVGRSHDWTRYIHSCPVAERVREFLSADEETLPTPPATETSK